MDTTVSDYDRLEALANDRPLPAHLLRKRPRTLAEIDAQFRGRMRLLDWLNNPMCRPLRRPSRGRIMSMLLADNPYAQTLKGPPLPRTPDDFARDEEYARMRFKDSDRRRRAR